MIEREHQRDQSEIRNHKSEIRLVVDPPAAGAWNMAVDEALLESAIERGVATLRFYQWSEPTLSLGYFQRYADRASHAASRDCPCVRRHSGGGAILHDRELTYSLALPAGMIRPSGAEAMYRAAHRALVDCLARLVPGAVDRLQLCPPGIARPAADEPFLCFQRRSDGDLLVASGAGDDKIVGSAQRKRRGAVLQHGSVLLSRSPAAPELPGVAELLGADLEVAELREACQLEFAAQLEMPIEAGTITPEERRDARRICDQKFATDRWSRRR